MATKKNKRCPLQEDCGRRCQYELHELDCDYYKYNAIDEDTTIPDQEEIREREETRRREAEMKPLFAKRKCNK